MEPVVLSEPKLRLYLQDAWGGGLELEFMSLPVDGPGSHRECVRVPVTEEQAELIREGLKLLR